VRSRFCNFLCFFFLVSFFLSSISVGLCSVEKTQFSFTPPPPLQFPHRRNTRQLGGGGEDRREREKRSKSCGGKGETTLSCGAEVNPIAVELHWEETQVMRSGCGRHTSAPADRNVRVRACEGRRGFQWHLLYQLCSMSGVARVVTVVQLRRDVTEQSCVAQSIFFFL
jgi:hypothetical protein